MVTEDSVYQVRIGDALCTPEGRGSEYSARFDVRDVVAAGERVFASSRENCDGRFDSIGGGWCWLSEARELLSRT